MKLERDEIADAAAVSSRSRQACDPERDVKDRPSPCEHLTDVRILPLRYRDSQLRYRDNPFSREVVTLSCAIMSNKNACA